MWAHFPQDKATSVKQAREYIGQTASSTEGPGLLGPSVLPTQISLSVATS
jgi:hypothetical protein